MADDVSVSIGAKDTGATRVLQGTVSTVESTFSKLRGAMGGVTGSATQMGGAFDTLGGSVTRVTGLFGALAAVIAGGTFKATIDQTNQLTSEATKLAKTLNMDSVAASALNTALGDIGADADTYTGAFMHFAQQLRKNEEGIQQLGIRTRDANGHLRDSNDVFREALAAVGTYKPGLDQATFAMNVFGRSVDDVMKLQRLNNDVIEEARAKNEALGLTITKDNVEASKRYKAAMNDVGDVMSAIGKVVGQSIIPIFSSLGEWFAERGPRVVEIFRSKMPLLVGSFRVVEGAIKTLVSVFIEGFSLISDGAGLIGQVFSRLMSRDWEGAWNASKLFGERIAQAGINTWKAFIDAGNDVGRDIGSDMERLAKPGGEAWRPGSPVGGGKRMGDDLKPGSGGDKSRMSKWETALAEDRVALTRRALMEGQFREMSKAEEVRYWTEIKARHDLNESERVAVSRKIAEAEIADMKTAFDAKVATLQAESAEYKANTEAKIAKEREIQALYVAGSKEHQAAQARIAAIERDAARQRLEIERTLADQRRALQTAQIDAMTADAALQLELRRITVAESLAIEERAEVERQQIQIEGKRAEVARLEAAKDRDAVAIARGYAEIEAMESEHQARMAQIRGRAVIEQQKYTTGFVNSLQSGFQGLFQGLMNGTIRWGNLWRSTLAMMGNVASQIASQMLAEWLINSIKSRIFAISDGLSKISANAAVAGSAAFASTAAIPMVGPFMAPGAAAEAYAGTMAFAAMLPSAAAAKGFDIPAGSNPVTQLHQREMVLPADIADPLRAQINNGGAMGGDNIHLHLSALDGRSARDFLLGNRAALGEALRAAHRDGHLNPRGS